MPTITFPLEIIETILELLAEDDKVIWHWKRVLLSVEHFFLYAGNIPLKASSLMTRTCYLLLVTVPLMRLDAFSTKALKSQIIFANWITLFVGTLLRRRCHQNHWNEYLDWNSFQSGIIIGRDSLAIGATTWTQSPKHCFTSYIFLPLLTSQWLETTTSSYLILYLASTSSIWISTFIRLWQLKQLSLQLCLSIPTPRIRTIKNWVRKLRYLHEALLSSTSWWTTDYRFWVSVQDNSYSQWSWWRRGFTGVVQALSCPY